ncbi:hypothetical protein RB4425 [Rhodopirellula baltica SH 1]|uniref:Uncharacterized protein n=1 Tax=Rhodopirellula baltica (strain DSM 10527 / NCIMB 13988 / SH1) TaxID=243090 RepID=Q7USL8_RHOBA|nr:hypothetical protein RB4425 [Rhodopirellula baltica SH 1]
MGIERRFRYIASSVPQPMRRSEAKAIHAYSEQHQTGNDGQPHFLAGHSHWHAKPCRSGCCCVALRRTHGLMANVIWSAINRIGTNQLKAIGAVRQPSSHSPTGQPYDSQGQHPGFRLERRNDCLTGC